MTLNIPHDPAADYKARFKDAADLFGGAEKVPASNIFTLSERLRAHYVVEKAVRDNVSPMKELKNHSVDKTIIAEIVGLEPEELEEENKPKRRTVKEAAEDWIIANAGKEVSLNEVSQETSLTYAQVNKMVKDRPDLFTKMQKGQYVLRDPKADREAEKS
jgi:hypothetical protein